MTDRIEREFNEFDFEKNTVEEIEKYFSGKILGHNRPTINISPDGLFRARIIENTNAEDLKTVKSIWYPDFKEIDQKYHQLNRCSNIGQNFFYSSNYLGATIKELNPNNDDLVMIGIFHKKFKKIKFRSQYAGIEALKTNPDRDSELEKYEYPSKTDELIEKYISSKFQEKIKNGEEYKYKSSIAFSNILLKNDGINCIIYPSVASELKYVNYGIKAKFVDDFLFCNEVYIYKIKKNSIEFELTPIQFAKQVLIDRETPKNSIIEWQENTDLERDKTIKYSL
ncbi:hypothetical protein CW736_07795 [Nonlabens sp. MB-3u-79]|uniref:hypothetical protein n=1 Tax=Nonlabens sp. MB-3u-79 TaxID=2058134 RepID=UPI000C30ED66|nr:hypothetical protein [Nonlabens sp. MB-3u-79]AUC79292.1 hypothetical protein CW736_07795 [Nonlabens sp. MB-3u-79]